MIVTWISLVFRGCSLFTWGVGGNSYNSMQLLCVSEASPSTRPSDSVKAQVCKGCGARFIDICPWQDRNFVPHLTKWGRGYWIGFVRLPVRPSIHPHSPGQLPANIGAFFPPQLFSAHLPWPYQMDNLAWAFHPYYMYYSLLNGTIKSNCTCNFLLCLDISFPRRDQDRFTAAKLTIWHKWIICQMPTDLQNSNESISWGHSKVTQYQLSYMFSLSRLN